MSIILLYSQNNGTVFGLNIPYFTVTSAFQLWLAFIGGILGLAFRAEGLGLFFPYSLFSIGMCSNDPLNIECSIISFIISSVIFTAVFCIIGIKFIDKEN